jgi:hypothetical protein
MHACQNQRGMTSLLQTFYNLLTGLLFSTRSMNLIKVREK